MIHLYPFERSFDWNEEISSLTVRSIYDTVVNLKSDSGTRFSLLLKMEDYLPRSALIEALPALEKGQEIVVDLKCVAEGFDPSCLLESPKVKWKDLLLEWLEFLKREELADLLDNIDKPEKMIGLGPGSTPAGDDFLVGLIMAFRLTGIDSNELGIDRNTLGRKTEWFSSEMIRDALDGKFWKRGIDLARALAGDDVARILEKAGKIVEWGHLSGKAWLAGLAYGLEQSGVY
ncbi:DUF2877 domain-containing protein [Mesotoga sp.]|jgi:hypothetical protein|uniref:Ig-like domain-containing protein n=1 Tax=Mesotoga infera TaxID=1236046 RepID=A0A101I084_9BACT|nr:MAG: Uncharacterized protein XE02_1413 [Mesotoga infera]HCO69427.1 hypothetical protein [Mesotoga infera]